MFEVHLKDSKWIYKNIPTFYIILNILYPLRLYSLGYFNTHLYTFYLSGSRFSFKLIVYIHSLGD